MTCKRTCRIIFARHGQTEWNKDFRFQGIADIPLDDEGIRQAEKLSRRLSSWPPEVIYTSPLKRANLTASIISHQFAITPIILPELVEINFGSWEGVSIPQLERDNPDIFERWRSDPFFTPPDGSELWPQISQRLTHAVNVMLSSGYERVIAVAHGGVIRALMAVILGVDPHRAWNIEVSNCSITGIEYRDGIARLNFANDDLHIRGGKYGAEMPLWGDSYEPLR